MKKGSSMSVAGEEDREEAEDMEEVEDREEEDGELPAWISSRRAVRSTSNSGRVVAYLQSINAINELKNQWIDY